MTKTVKAIKLGPSKKEITGAVVSVIIIVGFTAAGIWSMRPNNENGTGGAGWAFRQPRLASAIIFGILLVIMYALGSVRKYYRRDWRPIRWWPVISIGLVVICWILWLASERSYFKPFLFFLIVQAVFAITCADTVLLRKWTAYVTWRCLLVGLINVLVLVAAFQFTLPGGLIAGKTKPIPSQDGNLDIPTEIGPPASPDGTDTEGLPTPEDTETESTTAPAEP